MRSQWKWSNHSKVLLNGYLNNNRNLISVHHRIVVIVVAMVVVLVVAMVVVLVVVMGGIGGVCFCVYMCVETHL